VLRAVATRTCLGKVGCTALQWASPSSLIIDRCTQAIEAQFGRPALRSPGAGRGCGRRVSRIVSSTAKRASSLAGRQVQGGHHPLQVKALLRSASSRVIPANAGARLRRLARRAQVSQSYRRTPRWSPPRQGQAADCGALCAPLQRQVVGLAVADQACGVRHCRSRRGQGGRCQWPGWRVNAARATDAAAAPLQRRGREPAQAGDPPAGNHHQPTGRIAAVISHFAPGEIASTLPSCRCGRCRCW